MSRGQALTILEVVIILAWALAFTWPYFDFDPHVIPDGREYPSLIQPYHLWTRLLECGACALWNGSIRGGLPAFADLHAALLHPLPVIAVLLAGVSSGMKLTLIGTFMMAGLGQWWLGWRLHTGRLARVWSACMVVAAGCLASRMESGWIHMVLSTAAAALVFPALVGFARYGSRRWAAVLGLTLALLALSGQGYLQIGMAFVLPLGLILVEPGHMAFVLRRFGWTLLVALLVAAPFWVPMLHFLPQYSKDADTAITSAQAFRFVPLNLVIDEASFFANDGLAKDAIPALNVNFVGWLPVLLAVVAVVASAHRERWHGERRHIVFLLATMLTAFWVASAVPFRWLISLSPSQALDWRLAGIRNPSPIAGLAVVGILALAALAVDRLWSADWTPAQASLKRGARAIEVRLEPRWLILVPLVLALGQAAAFSRQWVRTSRLDPEIYLALEGLRTPSLEWVNPPYGEHIYVDPGVGMGLKLAEDNRVWHWVDHPNPEPYLAASRSGPLKPEMTQLKKIGSGVVAIYQSGPETRYATVQDGDRLTVCTAQGIGGNIDVTCDAPAGGVLTVREHYWSGWQATVDGVRSPLHRGIWMSLDLPAGAHTVQLRYRPWDVWLGMLLGAIGWALAIFLIWRGDAPLAHRVLDRLDTRDEGAVPVGN